MIRNDRYKLHYFPAGNRFLLFDMIEDPDEMHDLSDDPAYQDVRTELEQALIEHFYGSDLEWVEDGELVGMPEPAFTPRVDRGLSNQRGWRFM
jgi:arylsulfatase A-like enzyme